MTNPNPGALPDPERAAALTGGIVPEFSLGDRLRKAREIAGLEQIALAAEIEVHRQSIARYESGASIPRRPVMLSWAMMTGVSLDWLATGETGNSTHVERSTASTDSVDRVV